MLAAQPPSRSCARSEAEEREVVERLAAADRARADVVGQLSQEIRKPLAIVTETTRALQDADEEAKARLFERLTAGTTALDVTLGGLLDVSLLDAEDMPLEIGDVDLGGLVTGAAERLSGLFVDRELRLQAPEGFTVEADRALLARAVESLLAAAATSTPPRRTVEVAVTRTEGRTTLKIAGDGVIPPELVAKIREPFGDDAGVAGPVARLALASKIVELHGELEVRASPGRGHASGSSSLAIVRPAAPQPRSARGSPSPGRSLLMTRSSRTRSPRQPWRSHLRRGRRGGS